MKQIKQSDLLQMLTYKRPAWTPKDAEFIRRYIDPIPGVYPDEYGNRILANDGSRVMIACHTDTVHWEHGRQRITVKDGIAGLDSPAKELPLGFLSRSGLAGGCLGADDTAGVYAALRMIQAGVKCTFVFHRAEEIGGRGSQWLADTYPEWLKTFDICLSLDRRGTGDIITSQLGQRMASDVFAASLSDALGMGHVPTEGIFTDSANYAHLIPECGNLSIGYSCEHSVKETLNLDYLERVIERLIAVDWKSLEVSRVPSMKQDHLITSNWWDKIDDDDLEEFELEEYHGKF